MDKEALIRRERTFAVVSLVLGIAVLGAGLLFNPHGYHKALEAISIVLFAMAFASLVKIRALKRNDAIPVAENDERIVAARNQADAVSLEVIRRVLFLAYLFYTFVRPGDIFQSLSWWLLLAVSMLSLLLPPLVLGNVNKRFQPDDGR
ncbi:MAG: hypothetical protein M0R22_02425 [Dehalococcoidia bacterium]|jgi:hypothetical protein|nr:hypothetical protein [Dehalococcoidia bacterium]